MQKNNLLIIGARGFGREIYNFALESLDPKQYQIKGFLDDKTDALDGYSGYPPVISPVETYVVQPEDVFICALGDVGYKRKYAEMILSKGGKFISIKHPSANISMNATIGCGCIIIGNVTVSCDVTVGDFVTIMENTVLGHDARVGDWSHIGAGSFMGGFSRIGSMVTLHPHVELLPHKIVEDHAVLGAGSIVLKHVKAGMTVFGNPAKKMEL